MSADATDESAKVLVLLVNAERLNETASEVSCNRERQVRQPLGTMQAKFLEALKMDLQKQCTWSNNGWARVR